MLVQTIGRAAMLEQTAEECTELAQACLKLARALRGENPVYKNIDDIAANLHEEIADVEICIDELVHGDITDYVKINAQKGKKHDRMRKRLEMLWESNYQRPKSAEKEFGKIL